MALEILTTSILSRMFTKMKSESLLIVWGKIFLSLEEIFFILNVKTITIHDFTAYSFFE